MTEAAYAALRDPEPEEVVFLRRISLRTPYPPTVNHYWGSNGNRRFVATKGLAFRRVVERRAQDALNGDVPLTGPVSVEVEVFPPDNRRRDIDNVLKALLDALEHGGIYADDSQVWALIVRRGAVTPDGACKVEVRELPR